MIDSQLLTLLLVFLFFLIALIYDLKYQVIPNKICISFFVIGLFFQMFKGDPVDVSDMFLALLLTVALLFPLFVIKALGGGDVKLMMAVSILLGVKLTFYTIIFGLICGVFTSVFLSLKHVGFRGVKATFLRYYDCFFLRKYFKPEEGEAAALRVPYAPALALGWIWACYLNDDIMMTISSARFSLAQ